MTILTGKKQNANPQNRRQSAASLPEQLAATANFFLLSRHHCIIPEFRHSNNTALNPN